jgi:hypothetical protein
MISILCDMSSMTSILCDMSSMINILFDMSSIINILSGMSSRIKITALLPENADDSATLIQKLGIDLFYNDYLFYFYKASFDKM